MVFPYQLAQTVNHASDMPTGQSDLNSPSLRLFPNDLSVTNYQFLTLNITKLVWWLAPVIPTLRQSLNPARIQGSYLKTERGAGGEEKQTESLTQAD